MHTTVLFMFVLTSHVAEVDRGTQSGQLAAPQIVESSGVAASRLSRGMFWTHNDSGDGPLLFLIDPEEQAHKLRYIEGILAQ